MKQKNNITLIISKNAATIYDHRFDIIEKHNYRTFETILGFWFFFLTQQAQFFSFFNRKRRHRKSDVIKHSFFFAQYIFYLTCNDADL